MSEWAWRLPFLLQLIPGLVLGVGIVFLPFSPRWLVSKGRDEEALHNLAKLRRLPTTDHRVQIEWFDIRAEVTLHKEISKEKHPHLQERTIGNRIKLEIASWTDLSRKGCWRRTHVGVGLMFFQQVSPLLKPFPIYGHTTSFRSRYDGASISRSEMFFSSRHEAPLFSIFSIRLLAHILSVQTC